MGRTERSTPREIRLAAADLQEAYEAGHRKFWHVNLDGVDLRQLTLRGASFLGASLKGARMDGMDLTYVQLKSANLMNASLRGARLIATDLIGTNFGYADLSEADLTGATLVRARFRAATLTRSSFNGVRLGSTELATADLDEVRLYSANLIDTDIRSLIDARDIYHAGPSHIDARTVMKSYKHPRLKRFLQDCGVPAIFAEYMIDCARALGEPLLRSMMQSTFISYGGPDERFARRIYNALREHHVSAFFFPENATVGERIGDEVFKRLQEHDRVILVCSRASLDRPGVLHEIQETFNREDRDGGATYLLPIALDDYALTEWGKKQPRLAERLQRRVVADFRKAARSQKAFESALSRLLDALKVKQPTAMPLSL